MKIIIFALACVFFVSTIAFALPSGEVARLDAMFELLAQEDNSVFIRNGDEYGAMDAVAHLKRKLSFAARFLDTAEEFIDKAATKSSVSGELYFIRNKADNVTTEAAPYLKNLLKKADESAKAQQ